MPIRSSRKVSITKAAFSVSSSILVFPPVLLRSGRRVMAAPGSPGASPPATQTTQVPPTVVGAPPLAPHRPLPCRSPSRHGV
jgi:hypothetical protein